MKSTQHPHRRAFAALVPATLLLAAPALAQEAAPPTQTVTPPPVVPTLPQASAPASGPQPLTNGVSARNGIGDPNSATPIAPEAIAQAEEARAARTTPTRAAPRATAQRAAPMRTAATQGSTAASAPAAAAPTAAAPTATAPVAIAPAATEPATPVTTPAETTAPASSATTDTTTTAATTTGGAPIWPWIVGGLVVLAGLLAFFLRRRNRADEYEEVYEEPVYAEPAVQTAAEPAVIAPAAVAPIAAAPVSEQRQSQGSRLEPQFLRTAPLAAAAAAAGSAAEQADAVAVEAELVEPEAEDVAALTAATDHADRPWLEFAMRPVRAGSNADDALVEIELTVGNSGAIDAQDVRISTFMFADGSASLSEMERLLTAHAADSEVSPVTIPAGEGTRVDATLSLPKEHLGDETRAFNPVIVADARYRLADGSEGRTSASFTIGRVAEDGEDMGGIAIHRAQMSDDIEARLHGEPAHA